MHNLTVVGSVCPVRRGDVFRVHWSITVFSETSLLKDCELGYENFDTVDLSLFGTARRKLQRSLVVVSNIAVSAAIAKTEAELSSDTAYA